MPSRDQEIAVERAEGKTLKELGAGREHLRSSSKTQAGPDVVG
jgi:hypothetical protein